MTFEIRPLGKDNVPAEISLLELAFDEEKALLPTQTSMMHKYYENPVSIDAIAFGAFDGERLVGMDMYMPAWYTCNGIRMLGVQTCDSAVDPDYQRRGIFSQITKTAEAFFAEHGVDFFFGCPNSNSYPTYKKRGWTEAAHCKYAHIPLRITGIAEEKMQRRIPSFFDGVYWALCFPLRIRAKRNHALRIEESGTGDPAIFCSNVGESISFEMDAKTIQWKCEGESFHFYSVFAKETPLARFIIKKTSIAAVVIAHDFFTKDRKTQIEAISLLANTARNQGYAVLSFWTGLGTEDMRAFVRAGAIKYDHYKKGLPYMIKVLTTDRQKTALLQDTSRWRPLRIELDTVIDNFDTTQYARHFFR